MKKKFEINPEIVMIIVMIVLIGAFVVAIGCRLAEVHAEEAAYASMTAEERAEYDAPYTTEYKVVKVEKYVIERLNKYGAVLDTDISYDIVYVDDEGVEHTMTDFCNGSSYRHVVIGGDEDKVVFNTRDTSGVHKTLCLTRDTVAQLSLGRK